MIIDGQVKSILSAAWAIFGWFLLETDTLIYKTLDEFLNINTPFKYFYYFVTGSLVLIHLIKKAIDLYSDIMKLPRLPFLKKKKDKSQDK